MAFQNKTVTYCYWHTIHDSDTPYRALASAASEGASHRIMPQVFQVSSQQMMHIILELTNENVS